MESLHFAPQNLTLLFINFILLCIFAYGIARNIIKASRLSVAMDHYTLINEPKNDKKELIIDIVKFDKEYPKSVELIKAIEDPQKKLYYTTEVTLQLLKQLVESKAVQVEFIEGVEHDTIFAELKYLLEV